MKNCCNSSCIVAHILFIIGAYVLTWGLIGSGSFGAVLKSPVFWGIILILGGFCCVHAPKKMK